jgi:hypothetical protein
MEDHHWGGQGWNSSVKPEEENKWYKVRNSVIEVHCKNCNLRNKK